jgi:DNA-binding MarR family transcriptional regulator
MRQSILVVLGTGPRAVGELAEALPVTRPAVSKHLRALERAGLVEHETHGTRHVYRLRPDGTEAIRAWLDRVWDSVLERYAAVAEATEEDER